MDRKKIKDFIEYSLLKTRDYSKKDCKEIAFHMTDWIDNFQELYELYAYPENCDVKEVERILMSFLIHVPEHIAASAKIMTGGGIKDIFKVGVFKDIEEDDD